MSHKKIIIRTVKEFFFYIKSVFLNALENIEIQEETSQFHTIKRFFASMEGGCIYINGIQVTLKKAKLQFAIFHVLAKARINGGAYSISKSLTINQIMDEIEKLEKTNIDAVDGKLIKKAIHTTRKNINKKIAPNLGNAIIESPENGRYQIGSKVALI